MKELPLLVRGLLIVLCFCSCSRAAEVWFYSDQGKTEQLQKRIADFHQAVYWGETLAAAKFVLPSVLPAVQFSVRKEEKKENYVKFDVAGVNIDPEDDSVAHVTVSVQSYRVPNYRIENRNVDEEWVFHRFRGGWFLKSTDLFTPPQDANKVALGQ